MKVNKKQREKTKIKLIEAAVDLIIKNGYEKSTMREIARKAGVGDATIYNYFSTKEQLVWGYVTLRQEQAVNNLAQIPDFETFSLQEKLHAYFECILEGYLPDREFISMAIKMTHKSILTHSDEVKKLNAIFINQIKQFLADAIKNEEIPEQAIETVIPYLILDLYFIILLYWTKDTSEQFNQTTQLIELLLSIAVSVLKQGLVSKLADLGSFLFRHHLFNHMETLFESASFGDIKDKIKKFKP